MSTFLSPVAQRVGPGACQCLVLAVRTISLNIVIWWHYDISLRSINEDLYHPMGVINKQSSCIF